MNKPPSRQFARRRVSYQPGLEEDQPVAHPIWQPGAQESSKGFRPLAQPLYRNRDRGALGRLTNPNVPIRYR